MPAPSKYQEIERRYKKPMAAILQELFASQQTEAAVAKQLGVGQATVNTWLLKLRLRKRTVLVPETDTPLCEDKAS